MLRKLIALVIFTGVGVSAQYDKCHGTISYIGDAWCDDENNNAECGYDGEDCCYCSCVDGPYYPCGVNGFDCLDPEFAGDEFPDHIGGLTVDTPCPSDMLTQWTVNDTASATALANAILCSDGVFSVQWFGHVVVTQTIKVVNGTTLHVTGVGPGAKIDAGSCNRLFAVINASLSITNIEITGGDAIFGGAIAAARSYLSLDHTSLSGNSAFYEGGALYATLDSNASFGEEILFEGNNAGMHGGALSLRDASRATFHGYTSLTGNTAGDFGGAMFVTSSSVYWVASAIFSDNAANKGGGALFVFFSSLHWAGDAMFLNNTTNELGGALYVAASSIFWESHSIFSNNTALSSNNSAKDALSSNDSATVAGGALYVLSSNASWAGDATFFNNTADKFGGALMALRSKVSWGGDVLFTDNNVNEFGGALLTRHSNVSWGGDVLFSDNTANEWGGALVVLTSNVAWHGDAFFSDNMANNNAGGALLVSTSRVFWARDAFFSRNSANTEGGALVVHNDSNVHWGSRASFLNNAAGRRGGALFLTGGGGVVLEQGSLFVGNTASSSGGAAFIYGEDVEKQASSLYINGTTTFLQNKCGGDGGALAVVGVGTVTFATTNVTFSQNSAHASGGAIAVKGAGIGPQFTGLTFVSNHASIGGGVYVTSSGTATTDSLGVSVEHPTTFDRCIFIDNQAVATGGAINSRAGLDVIADTNFIGNTARAGGALRLAGISSLHNCTFTENTSGIGEGPAISNAGFVSSISSCSFIENAFKCKPGEFLDYLKTITPEGALDVACAGCDAECHQCTTSPRIPTCSEQLEHTESNGGNTTIEMLEVESGYWRATNASRTVLQCYNADACLGGLTGASNYCNTGYEGPYCSTCRRHYFAGTGYTCNRCSGDVIPVLVTVIVVASALLVGALLLAFVICGNSTGGAAQGLRASWRRRLMSLKIIVIVWQVMTQFSSVADIRYPSAYQRFLNGVNVINLDLSWILSAECIIDLNFHHRLLISTLGPPAALCFVGAMYAMYAMYRRRYPAPYDDFSVVAREENRYEYLPMVLLLTFLVYSSVSSTLFRMFAFDELDDGGRYLRADYRIDYNSSVHRYLQVYAALMMAVYTMGIPILYGTLLFRKRQVLTNESARQEDEMAKSVSSLWELYKPSCFYYELIECARRILLAGVVVFIFPNTAAQVAAALIIATFFMVLSEIIAPYESLWDAWINRIAHAIVFGSIYLALLLKIDVSDERDESQLLFETILIVGHACMIALVIIGGAVVTYQWTKRSG